MLQTLPCLWYQLMTCAWEAQQSYLLGMATTHTTMLCLHPQQLLRQPQWKWLNHLRPQSCSTCCITVLSNAIRTLCLTPSCKKKTTVIGLITWTLKNPPTHAGIQVCWLDSKWGQCSWKSHTWEQHATSSANCGTHAGWTHKHGMTNLSSLPHCTGKVWNTGQMYENDHDCHDDVHGDGDGGD